MQTLDPTQHANPLGFFLSQHRRELPWLALNAAFYSVASCSLVIGTYWLGRTIDIVQSGNGTQVFWYVCGMSFSLAVYEIGFRLGHIIEVRMLARIRNRTKKALFDHTTSLSYGYFTDRFSGEIAHKIAVTANSLERMTALVTNQVIEEGALAIASIAMLAFIHPYLGLFAALWLVAFLAGIRPLTRRLDTYAGEYAVQEAKTTGTFVDLYANIGTVKVYGHERMQQRAHEAADREMDAYRKLGFWSILTYHYQGISIFLLGTGLILIASHLFSNAAVGIGDIVIVAAVGLRMLLNVWEAGRAIPEFIRSRGEASENLSDLVAESPVADGSHTGVHRGAIGVEYRRVGFAYAGGAPVLENFSISIAPGEKVGIVGLSGAGKTTFANLLLRFFDARDGSVLLGGKDIREFTQESLRSHISHISQDTSLFHTTIAENIAYGAPHASRADIERAAHLAYADDFIRALPERYDSVVGERGVKLSGGQRQRIAIARAILADRPLFLLDEATSALDSESEEKIQKGLAVLMEGKTVIAIAHRLSTLSHLDRIVYMEGGRIVEDGTHEALLARGGKYATLWKMQAGGFLPSEL
jgi:ATP-binding cassette subfamily B protein